MGHEIIGNTDMIEELKENVAYLMENLNFFPDEHSYVEQWKDTDDVGLDDEEKKHEDQNNDENSQKLGQGKTAAKDPKKLSAAEK